MSQLVSARLPDATVERVKQLARRKQRSVNEMVAIALEEWLRQNEFACIEFRDTPNGRVAYLKESRLPVFWVIKVAKSYAMDIEKVLAYWPDRPRAWVQAAFNYYEAYPEEIEAQIAAQASVTFEELKRKFPQIEVIAIPPDPLRVCFPL